MKLCVTLRLEILIWSPIFSCRDFERINTRASCQNKHHYMLVNLIHTETRVIAVLNQSYYIKFCNDSTPQTYTGVPHRHDLRIFLNDKLKL